MACNFSYSGTSPVTTVAFTRNPRIGDWKRKRKWMSPMIAASGGEDRSVSDKGIVREIHSLRWDRLPAADWTSLLAFLAVVDGAAQSFDYQDPNGDIHTGRIWNPMMIRAMSAGYRIWDVTVEILITPPETLFSLVDESGALLKDENAVPLYQE